MENFQVNTYITRCTVTTNFCLNALYSRDRSILPRSSDRLETITLITCLKSFTNTYWVKLDFFITGLSLKVASTFLNFSVSVKTLFNNLGGGIGLSLFVSFKEERFLFLTNSPSESESESSISNCALCKIYRRRLLVNCFEMF